MEPITWETVGPDYPKMGELFSLVYHYNLQYVDTQSARILGAISLGDGVPFW